LISYTAKNKIGIIQNSISVFNDTQSYWVAPNSAIGNFGWSSVQVPHTGTTIRVKSVAAQGSFMQVDVNK
jgi:immune inhibitor A